MIFYKSKIGNTISNTYETKIKYRSLLNFLSLYNKRNMVVDELIKKINSLIEKLSNDLNLYSKAFISQFDNLNSYIESINSSSIENININETKNDLVNKENKSKIYGYMQALNTVSNLKNNSLDEKTLESLRNVIDENSNNLLRYKTNTTQFINNWRAPDNDNLKEGIDFYLQLFNFKEHEIISAIEPLFIFAYQHILFEIIHPFNDGNGRVGRILNVIFLKKYFETLPINLDLSSSIFNELNIYYDLFKKSVVEQNKYNLKFIETKNDSIEMDSIATMLNFLKKTLIVNIEKCSTINFVFENIENKLKSHFKNKTTKILNFFSTNPRFEINDFVMYLNITYKTALKYVKILLENEIIVESIDSKTTLNKSIYNVKELNQFINNIPKNKQ